MSTAPQTSAPKDSSHRDAVGRFKLGNPGNPFARQVAQVRSVILGTLIRRIETLTGAMFEQAEKGNVSAAKLILQYALGKPAAAVEPDRIEIEDFKLRAESALPASQWAPVLEHLQAKNVNDYAVATEPLMQSRLLEPMEQVLNGEVPTKLSRTARKAMYRQMRRLRRKNAPSPNGNDGAAANGPLEGGRRTSKSSGESGRAG